MKVEYLAFKQLSNVANFLFNLNFLILMVSVSPSPFHILPYRIELSNDEWFLYGIK